MTNLIDAYFTRTREPTFWLCLLGAISFLGVSAHFGHYSPRLTYSIAAGLGCLAPIAPEIIVSFFGPIGDFVRSILDSVDNYMARRTIRRRVATARDALENGLAHARFSSAAMFEITAFVVSGNAAKAHAILLRYRENKQLPEEQYFELRDLMFHCVRLQREAASYGAAADN